jgi:hypothetical protein
MLAYRCPHLRAVFGSNFTLCGQALPEADIKIQSSFNLFHSYLCELD